MGTFRIGCKIQHIAESNKTANVEDLVVDAGSCHTWLPGSVLNKLGVERMKNGVVFSQSGKRICRSVGYSVIRCGEFKTVDEVVFAEPGDVLVLGFRTLSGFNAVVDSKKKKLVAAGPVLVA